MYQYLEQRRHSAYSPQVFRCAAKFDCLIRTGLGQTVRPMKELLASVVCSADKPWQGSF